MPVWLLALPFFAGACLPLQAGINGQLARQLSSTFAAATVSFAVGLLALCLLTASQRELPSLSALKDLSWWHWSGGLLGMCFIAVAAYAGPRIGATLFMAIVIAGQLVMSLTLDHFGWAGFREAPVTLGKAAGVLLIGGGVWLISRN
ncbi:transporter family-2 protein [Pseudomonas duriflava]|uniref:Transporter family-2 protein n=1 Tax=Pseudomonas duriflava TaxID=459528 RepID=A0A562QC88_9PSED|nr:DMT family transporter [Pseudomonas duriflava]TWI54377.1 transporter family-2 protein [Pseudomonas duriflava]